jgi:acetyl esterase/lipase
MLFGGYYMSKYYSKEKIKIKSDGCVIKALILKPKLNKKPKEATPGILWIHGGGYITGMIEMIYGSRAIPLVKKYGAVVVTPGYRLSKKSKYPGALMDCYAALKYVKEHATELGINLDQIMVGGESAGGGLTVATCMYARDKGEVNVCYQMPLYPMIDDRFTESNKDNHAFGWNSFWNKIGWKAYLGDMYQKENIPAYAAPARQTDYSNLPPAYTFVGDIEPFYCETLTYIDNLKNAGIEAKVDVYPNCFHAFDMLQPRRKVSKKAALEFENNYLYAVKHYYKTQND